MGANETQHGGTHYKTGYEHWDWAVKMNMGPLEYAATKYLSRWWKKGGEVDLRKAGHYVEKIIEVYSTVKYQRGRDRLWNNGAVGIESSFADTRNFAAENDLVESETLVCWLLVSWTSEYELWAAKRILDDLAADPQRAAGGRAAPALGGTAPAAPAAPGAAAGAALGAAGGQPGGPPAASASERSAKRAIRCPQCGDEGQICVPCPDCVGQATGRSAEGMKHPFGYQGD